MAKIECPDCKWSGDTRIMRNLRSCPSCSFDILSHLSKFHKIIDPFVEEVSHRESVELMLKKANDEVLRKNRVIDILQGVCNDCEKRLKKAQKETGKNW